jgi:hypothetical protein
VVASKLREEAQKQTRPRELLVDQMQTGNIPARTTCMRAMDIHLDQIGYSDPIQQCTLNAGHKRCRHIAYSDGGGQKSQT